MKKWKPDNCPRRLCKVCIDRVGFLLTLFRMGFFGAAHGMGGVGAKRPPLSKRYNPYPTLMKLGTVIPYLKKIQKIHKSSDTPLVFC